MVHFEKLLGRTLQWDICNLHMLEKVYEKVFYALDGDSSGPDGLSNGPISFVIRQNLKNPYEKNNIVRFSNIPCDDFPILNDQVLQSISTDQRRFFQRVLCCIKGDISAALAEAKTGNITSARWINTSENVVDVYMRDPNPSENLVLLTKFTVLVYARVWAKLKWNPNFLNSSYHILSLLRYTIELFDTSILENVCYALQYNGFSLHPENIVVCMLGLNDYSERLKAFNIIKEVRSKEVKINRKFKIPKNINSKAKKLSELLGEFQIEAEPALTRKFSLKNLEELVRNGTFSVSYECHTQVSYLKKAIVLYIKNFPQNKDLS